MAAWISLGLADLRLLAQHLCARAHPGARPDDARGRASARRWATGRRGATALEYGLLVFGVSTASVVALQAIGHDVRGIFTDAGHSLARTMCAADSAPGGWRHPPVPHRGTVLAWRGAGTGPAPAGANDWRQQATVTCQIPQARVAGAPQVVATACRPNHRLMAGACEIIDGAGPVLSVQRLDPSPTRTTTLRWRLAANEPVRHLDAGDLALHGTTATLSMEGDGNGAIVTASGGDLGTTTTTIDLHLAPGQDVTDAVDNPVLRPLQGETAYAMDTQVSPLTVAASPAQLSWGDQVTRSGQIEPGGTLIASGAVTGSVSLDGDGGWSLTSAPLLWSGTRTVTLEARDALGNVATLQRAIRVAPRCDLAATPTSDTLWPIPHESADCVFTITIDGAGGGGGTGNPAGAGTLGGGGGAGGRVVLTFAPQAAGAFDVVIGGGGRGSPGTTSNDGGGGGGGGASAIRYRPAAGAPMMLAVAGGGGGGSGGVNAAHGERGGDGGGGAGAAGQRGQGNAQLAGGGGDGVGGAGGNGGEGGAGAS